jgi:hypothetical protein
MRRTEWILDPSVAAFYVMTGAWRVHALRRDESSIHFDAPPVPVTKWKILRAPMAQPVSVAIGPDQCIRIERTIFAGAEFYLRLETELARLRLEAFQRIEERVSGPKPASERKMVAP